MLIGIESIGVCMITPIFNVEVTSVNNVIGWLMCKSIVTVVAYMQTNVSIWTRKWWATVQRLFVYTAIWLYI